MRHVLCGTTGFSRLDIGQCDVGDPRVFGHGLVRDEQDDFDFLRKSSDLLTIRVENESDGRNKDRVLVREEKWTIWNGSEVVTWSKIVDSEASAHSHLTTDSAWDKYRVIKGTAGTGNGRPVRHGRRPSAGHSR